MVCVMFWWGFCLVLRDMSQYVCVTKGKWVEGQGDFLDPLGTKRLIVQIGSARVTTITSSLSQWS